jgi:uncharacterized Tic20 family protein
MTEDIQDTPQQPPYGQQPGEPMAPYGQKAPPYYGAQPPPPGQVPGWAPTYGYQGRPPVSPSDARMWSLFAHLGVFISYFVAPLVIYLIYKDRDPFIRRHAAQALNFQITMAIAYLVSAVLTLVFIGFFMLLVVGVCWIVFPILAAVAANNGREYTYPVAIPMIS